MWWSPYFDDLPKEVGSLSLTGGTHMRLEEGGMPLQFHPTFHEPIDPLSLLTPL